MDNDSQLVAIRNYIYNIFSDDASGHDFFHMKRVARMAKKIASNEQANPFICETAAWVHDIGDPKLFTDSTMAIKEMEVFLHKIGCTHCQVDRVIRAIDDIAFHKGRIPETLEGKIVQDADRLDAIGAVGIARTFAYGGANGQLLWHDDDARQRNTSIQHFYDKLLTLKDTMNTKTAKEIAVHRHQFMEMYLQQFLQEWQ
ncbi:HD domain-containing protein [Lentibacillus cibarius]|uniref:HD domain-containing protein n=1 Tax=Lentibacillus cibarius TaxID=2583219 RepID=A0A549YKX8_9BACI|nr:HD domain-containing protein [Lentibacillus cibarius]TRM12531.1 HD domain-containing protein [Lentibacillus cibarius]